MRQILPCVKKLVPFFENLSLPPENDKTKTWKDQQVVLETGPLMLRNILGPILTQPWTNVNTTFFAFVVVFFVYCLGWNHTLMAFSAKMQFLRHPKNKSTICEHTWANCSCQHVRFSAFLILGVFGTSNFWSDVVLIDNRKTKITKYQGKIQSKKLQENRKQIIRNSYRAFQNKRQQTETTTDHLEANNKQNKI